MTLWTCGGNIDKAKLKQNLIHYNLDLHKHMRIRHLEKIMKTPHISDCITGSEGGNRHRATHPGEAQRKNLSNNFGIHALEATLESSLDCPGQGSGHSPAELGQLAVCP